MGSRTHSRSEPNQSWCDGGSLPYGGPTVSIPLKARTLIADDHALLRQAVRTTLEAHTDFEVVAEADDGADAIDKALKMEVDLVIVDISMPKINGIHVTRHLAAHRPQTRVLVLTMHEREDLLHQAMQAGASGYVVKSAAPKDLVEAARAALRGDVVYPGTLGSHAPGDDESDGLSERELEVLKLVAEGSTNPEIGKILSISPKTVARHRSNMLAKLGMRDRVELTRYAIRRGLIEP
jgi:DNA-binding NarL/FixJ family response regulator